MSESEKMTVARAVEILREHDKWLDVGAGRPPFGPRELGKAISTVCDALEWRPIETAPIEDYLACEVVYDGKPAMGNRTGSKWTVSALEWVSWDPDLFRWIDHEVVPTHWRPWPEVPK